MKLVKKARNNVKALYRAVNFLKRIFRYTLIEDLKLKALRLMREASKNGCNTIYIKEKTFCDYDTQVRIIYGFWYAWRCDETHLFLRRISELKEKDRIFGAEVRYRVKNPIAQADYPTILHPDIDESVIKELERYFRGMGFTTSTRWNNNGNFLSGNILVLEC